MSNVFRKHHYLNSPKVPYKDNKNHKQDRKCNLLWHSEENNIKPPLEGGS